MLRKIFLEAIERIICIIVYRAKICLYLNWNKRKNTKLYIRIRELLICLRISSLNEKFLHFWLIQTPGLEDFIKIKILNSTLGRKFEINYRKNAALFHGTEEVFEREMHSLYAKSECLVLKRESNKRNIGIRSSNFDWNDNVIFRI